MPLTLDHVTDAATHGALAWSTVGAVCGWMMVRAIVDRS